MIINDDESILTSYLLGELSEEEKEQVEMHYLSDEGYFQSLLVAEDDLIDGYVRDILPADKREHFENYFLRSPERIQRVEIAKDLMHFVSERAKTTNQAKSDDLTAVELPSKPPGQSWIKRTTPWLAAAAMLLMLIGGAWLFFQNREIQKEYELAKLQQQELEKKQQEKQERIDLQEARNNELLRELENERNLREQLTTTASTPQVDQDDTVVLALVPGVVRGSEAANRFLVPPAKRWVKIRARFEDDQFQSYSATIRTAEGEVIARQSNLKARKTGRIKTVVMTVSANRLIENDYILTLTGEAKDGEPQDVGRFVFAITKK